MRKLAPRIGAHERAMLGSQPVALGAQTLCLVLFACIVLACPPPARVESRSMWVPSSVEAWSVELVWRGDRTMDASTFMYLGLSALQGW